MKVKVDLARWFLPKSLFLLQQLICRDHEIQGHQTPNIDAFMIKKVVNMLAGFDLDHEVRMPRLYCIYRSFDCQVEMKIHGRTFHTLGSTATSKVSVTILLGNDN